jgi:hypothetical protein
MHYLWYVELKVLHKFSGNIFPLILEGHKGVLKLKKNIAVIFALFSSVKIDEF